MWKKEKTDRLVDLYRQLRLEENYDVSSIVEEMGINKYSVVNKLVKLGIYVPRPKAKVVTKKLLVRQLNKLLDGEFWTLDKVNKDELLSLVDKVKLLERTRYRNY